MKNDAVYLKHILDAIAHIENFKKGMEKERFINNALVSSAVIRQLEIIGEAVKGLSPSLKQANGQVRWTEIAGLRNRLIHEYFGVDLSLVWIICQRDLPLLKNTIKQMLNRL